MKEKWFALQDWWDGVLASRAKYTAFCVFCGIVIGLALRSL
jgi:hypothetical protein